MDPGPGCVCKAQGLSLYGLQSKMCGCSLPPWSTQNLTPLFAKTCLHLGQGGSRSSSGQEAQCCSWTAPSAGLFLGKATFQQVLMHEGWQLVCAPLRSPKTDRHKLSRSFSFAGEGRGCAGVRPTHTTFSEDLQNPATSQARLSRAHLWLQ